MSDYRPVTNRYSDQFQCLLTYMEEEWIYFSVLHENRQHSIPKRTSNRSPLFWPYAFPSPQYVWQSVRMLSFMGETWALTTLCQRERCPFAIPKNSVSVSLNEIIHIAVNLRILVLKRQFHTRIERSCNCIRICQQFPL